MSAGAEPEPAAGPAWEAARPAARRRRLAGYEPLLVGAAAVVLVLVLWQAVALARLVPELFLPGPLDIAQALAAYATSPQFGIDVLTSAEELALGYGLAVVVALPIGLLMGWYRRLHYALDPFISFFNSTPRIALLPLLIIWFGIGIWSKVAVVFLGAFFPVVINTFTGVRSLDPALLRAARSFCASDTQIFRTIALPGSVPFILTGLRLGVGQGLIGVVVGELVAAQHGVGLTMATAGQTFQTATVFAALIIVAAAGVALQIGMQRLQRRFDAWRPS